MDLGSLELQIFVSLTIVLGGALVALICDYLKGNNEQLREHNIELRVRREEQERRMLLDRALYANQVAGAKPATESSRDDIYDQDAEARPLKQRRTVRVRGARRARITRVNRERVSDLVRPEVLARVAQQAESDITYSQDIQEEVLAPHPEPELQPLHQTAKPVEVVEQVTQTVSPPPPSVILRPLTVPALKLEEEIQRVAETMAVAPAPPPEVAPIAWSSPLLEEVIAASAERAPEPAVAVEVLNSCYEIKARAGLVPKPGAEEALQYLSGEARIELPVAQLHLTEEPALREVEAEPVEEPVAEILELPALVALEEVQTEPPPLWAPAVTLETAETVETVETVEEPAVAEVVAIEPVAEPVVEHYDDLVLPAGMQDLETWNQLLGRPNPVSGYVIMVKVDLTESASAPAEQIPELTETLMRSLLRDGDFGCRVGDNEWVFIYGHDTTGLNQRRVGMVPEKLWDFKLRNINLTNVTFKWGAVDVKSEPLLASLEAARSRLYATRRNRMLPGSHGVGPRWVVNG